MRFPRHVRRHGEALSNSLAARKIENAPIARGL
jgi:hypothetical protein